MSAHLTSGLLFVHHIPHAFATLSDFSAPGVVSAARIVTRSRSFLDNGKPTAIAETQLQGLANPLSRPGRFSTMESLVHVIDNWILDKVVGPLPAAQRTAAE